MASLGGGGGKRIFGEFSKVETRDDGTIVVSGIASTEDVDKDGEVVKADAMRLAIPGYMKFGAIREMHQPTAAGTALACEVHGDGKTYLEAHIVDPVAVLKVKTGTYKGFSIGGRVPPGGRNVHDAKIIESLVLTEISLVDSPANPSARIQLFKADGLSDDPPVVVGTMAVEGTVTEKGDSPGHPFRGNQYGDGEGGGGAKDPQDAADEKEMMAEQERRVADGTANLDPDDRKAERQRLGRMDREKTDDSVTDLERGLREREAANAEQLRIDRDEEEQQDAATFRSYKEKVSAKDIAEMDGSEINRRGRFAQQARSAGNHEKAANFHAAMARYHGGQGNQSIAGANAEAAKAHRAAATMYREHNASDGEKHQGIDIDATSTEAREASLRASDARDPVNARQSAIDGKFKVPRQESAQREATARGRTERRQAKGMPRHVPEPRKSLAETNPLVARASMGSSGTRPAVKNKPGYRGKADVEIDLTKRLDGFTDEGEPVYTVVKGDVEGHPFRGNQYSDGSGADGIDDDVGGLKVGTPEYHSKKASSRLANVIGHVDGANANLDLIEEEMDGGEDPGLIRDGLRAAKRRLDSAEANLSEAKRSMRQHDGVSSEPGKHGLNGDYANREAEFTEARERHAKLKTRFSDDYQGKADEPEMVKGDLPGHEFRGNQYSHGGGGGNAPPARETKGFGKDGQPVVGRQTKAPARKKAVRQPDSFKGAESAKTVDQHRAAVQHHADLRRRHIEAMNAADDAGDRKNQVRHAYAASAHELAGQAHRTAIRSADKAWSEKANRESARAHTESNHSPGLRAKADTDIDITKAAPGAPQEEAMADPKAMAQGEEADAAACDDCGATLTDGSCPECAGEAAEGDEGGSAGAGGSSGEVAADPSTGTRDDDDTADGTAAEGNRFQARAAKIAKAANIELAALRKERDAAAARARAAEEALADLQAKSTSAATKLAKVASRADEASTQITKLHRAHAEVSETLEKVTAERDGMRERLAKVQAERDAVSADVLRIRSDNDDAEHAVAKLTGDRDSMSERLAKVQQERDRADEELGKVRAARDLAETSFEKVAAEKAITDGRLSKVSVERDNAVADAAKMRVERDASEDRFEKAASERDVLAQRATKAQADFNAAADRLAKVQANAERAEITITKMASEIDAANQRAARLSKAVDAAEALASSTAASLDAERVSLAKVNAETATLRKALDRARVERDDIAKARDEANAENARKLEEISTLKKMSDKVRTERDEAARARDAALADAQRKGEEIDGLKKVAERDRLVAKGEITRVREAAAAEAQRKTEEIDSIKKALDRERLVAKTEIAKKAKEADDLRKAASAAADAAAAARRAKLAADSERDAANSELARRPKGALRAALPVEKGLDTASAQTGEEAAKPEAPASPMDAIRKAHQNPKLLQNVNR